MIPFLKGVRILDLTAVILGPYATQILGDLGAEVIKIEPPEGDSMRTIAPVATPGMSAIYANVNRNKRSVALDLKSPGGKAALRKLIPTADAFVHNMRQEALDRLGFTFDAVRSLNPRIVYAAAVGYGRHGRYAGKPAYDDVIQAASGFAGLFQMRGGEPVYAPTIAADKVSGLHLAYAVLGALFYRERQGAAPGYIEVPMYELMAAFSLSEHLAAATFDAAGQVGYTRVLSPSRKPYRTKDGWVALLPYSAENWRKVLSEIGRLEVADEAWFNDPTARSARIDDLYRLLEEALPARTNAEWLAVFERLDIPSQPVRSPAELLDDPHLNDVGLFEPDFSAPSLVKRSLRLPMNVEDVARGADLPPPMLGADTEAVLRAAGCTDAEIAAACPGKA
ncbi:MAG: CoA transferase [Hyphomicrobiaceae bacterium]|nr:CoA transferase [Hyphomicrobiaceae bacterium]